MSRIVLRWFGILTARLAYFFGVRRTVTIDNLRNAFPELSAESILSLAKRSFSNLGIVFAEFIYLRFGGLKKIASLTHCENPELFNSDLAQKRGLIVVAGHFSNWEWLAVGGAVVLKENFAIVRKNIQTGFSEKFLEKMRKRSGNSLVNAGDIRGMYRILQANGCIALLADQAAPSGSVRVRFFGREVPTFEGPARLALRTGAPMLFARCRRGPDGGYAISFVEVPHDDLSGDSAANILELTARHTRCLEDMIRESPEQWLWQHRRWKNA